MPLLRSHSVASTSAPRRRAANASPRCRGGASSVLRLGQGGPALVPMARALAQRMLAAAGRAAVTP